MAGIAAVSFFSNVCTFHGCGIHFDSLVDLIAHIEAIHIVTDPHILEKQEQQQPQNVALSYINRFMTDAGIEQHRAAKKTLQLSSSVTDSLGRKVSPTVPSHIGGNVNSLATTSTVTPSSSLPSSPPTGSEYDEEDVGFEESDSDESYNPQSATNPKAILATMCVNEEDVKPFACSIPGCGKKYKNMSGIKYHAEHGHRQRKKLKVEDPFKCWCGKTFKSSASLSRHTFSFHRHVFKGPQ